MAFFFLCLVMIEAAGRICVETGRKIATGPAGRAMVAGRMTARIEAPMSDGIADGESIARRVARWLLALAYLAAGIAHLRSPDGFIAITPAWVPYPAQVVALTGVAEIAGAAGLMIPRVRRAAAIGLALYALCVWPANINHALGDIPLRGARLSWWYHGPRLALQPVIIWWALWAGGVTRWPFRGKQS